MKQFKRVMAMLLTLVMTLGLFAGLTLPASAATVTGTFTKITSSSDMTDGTYVFVGNGNSKAMRNDNVASNWVYPSTDSFTDDTIKNPDSTIVWTVSSGKISPYGGSTYLYASAAKKIALSSTYTTWSFSYSSGVWDIKGGSSIGSLRFNDTGWRPYTSSTGTAGFQIYKLQASTTYSATINNSTTSYGSVTADKTWTAAGTTITLTISPNSGYQLASISAKNASTNAAITLSGTGNTRTFTSPAANVTVTVSFEAISAPTHTLSSSVSPSGGGSVSLSASTVAEGATATATATPAAGYDFTSWSISGTGASLSSTSANPTTVTMGTANATVTANFTAKTPAGALTLSEAGTPTSVSVSGKYVGDTVTLPDDPTNYPADTDYNTFIGWYAGSYSNETTAPSGGSFYAPGGTYTLTGSAVTLKAVYAKAGSGTPNTYNLVTDTSGITAGNYVLIVKGGGAYGHDGHTYFALTKETVNTSYVRATNADDYMDDGDSTTSITCTDTTVIWTLTGTYSSFTLTDGSSNTLNMSTNNLYYNTSTATNFTAAEHNTSDTFTINGGRYLGLRDDLTTYDSYGYARFRGNSSASNSSYRFYMFKEAGSTPPTDYETDFATYYTIGLSTTSHGTATAKINGTGDNVTTATEGQEVYLYVTPDTHYHFDTTNGWEVVGDDSNDTITVTGYNTQNGAHFTMPAEDVIVAANMAIDTHTLTVNSDHGTVSDGTNNLTIGDNTYSYGDIMELTATPTGNYAFTGWTVSGLTEGTDYSVDLNNKLTITVNADCTVTANYVLKRQITLSYDSAMGTLAANEWVLPGTEQTVAFEALSGYELQSLTVAKTGSGESVAATPAAGNTTTAGSYTFTMPTAAVTVTATFVAQTNPTYVIELDTVTGGTIAVDGNLASAEENTTITLIATPDAGYTFDGWTVLEDPSTNLVTVTNNQFTMPASKVFVSATFTAIDYNLTGSITTGSEHGSISGLPAHANVGDEITFSVTPDEGYKVRTVVGTKTTRTTSALDITDNGDNTYTFTMPAADINITATITALESYTVTFIPYEGAVASEQTTVTVEEGNAIGNANVPTWTAPTGYSFSGYVVGNTYEQSSAPSSNYYATKAAMAAVVPTANMTVYGVWYQSGEETYELVTDSSDLVANGTYVIAAKEALFAMGTDGNTSGSNRYGVTITKSGNTLTATTGVDKLTLVAGYTSDTWSFVSSLNGYLYAGNGNYLYTDSLEERTDETCDWTISVTSAGVATITSANYTARSIRYNNSGTNKIFACYTTGQGDVALYKQTTSSGSTTYTTNPTLPMAHTVTFKNYDQTTVLDGPTTVRTGEKVTYGGATPTKAADATNAYSFKGWSTDPAAAAADAISTANLPTLTDSDAVDITYYAIFEAQEFTYSVAIDQESTTIAVSTDKALSATFTTNNTNLDTSEVTYAWTPVTGTTLDAADFELTSPVNSHDYEATLTPMAAGKVVVRVTASYSLDGGATTLTTYSERTFTVVTHVVSDVNGGYMLMTPDNTAADAADFDWSGDYLIAARENGLAANKNNLYLWTPNYTSGNLDSTTPLDKGHSAATKITDTSGNDLTVGVTAGATTTGLLHPSTTMPTGVTLKSNDGNVYDQIDDISDEYVFTIEKVLYNNKEYYTIRIKGTNKYLTITDTEISSTSGSNDSFSFSTSDAEETDLSYLWTPFWFSTSGGQQAHTESYVLAFINLASYNYNNSSSNPYGTGRAIMFNCGDTRSTLNGMFRVYGYNAWTNSSPLFAETNASGYNIVYYGVPHVFSTNIYYAGNQVNIAAPAALPASSATWTLTSNYSPSLIQQPDWSLVSGPVWSIVTQTADMTIDESTGVITRNTAAVGDTAEVQVTYTFYNATKDAYDVATSHARLVVVEAETGAYTEIYKISSGKVGTDTVSNQNSNAPLAAYAVNEADPTMTGLSNEDMAFAAGTLTWGVTQTVNGNAVTVFRKTDDSGYYYLDEGEETAFTGTLTSVHGIYDIGINNNGVVTYTLASGATAADDTVQIVAANGEVPYLGKTATQGTFLLRIRALDYKVNLVAKNATNTYTSSEYLASDTISSSVTTTKEYSFRVTDTSNATEGFTVTRGSRSWLLVGETYGATISDKTGDDTATDNGRTVVLDLSNMDRSTAHTLYLRVENISVTDDTTHDVTGGLANTIPITVEAVDGWYSAADDTYILDFARSAILNVGANDQNFSSLVGISADKDGTYITSDLSLLNGGVTASVEDNKVKLTFAGLSQVTETMTFYYKGQGTGSNQAIGKITFKPGAVVYYEDNHGLFHYTDGAPSMNWTTDGTLIDGFQYPDGLYEYDSSYDNYASYSGGAAHKVTVTKGGESWPYVTFTFNGTGVDIYSVLSNTTGTMQFEVYSGETATGTPVKRQMVNTYQGYDLSGPTLGFADSVANYYQIPVIRWSTATAGTYTVKLMPRYLASLDNTSDTNAYDLYFDAARIHNPIAGSKTYSYMNFRSAVLTGESLGELSTTAHTYAATIAPTTMNLTVGGSAGSITACTLTIDDVTQATTYPTITSLDTSVATVTDYGNGTATVTPVAAGSTTVRATYTVNGRTVTADCAVTVSATSVTNYTVTYKVNGETYSTQEVAENGTATLPTLTGYTEANGYAHDYTLVGWATSSQSATTSEPSGLYTASNPYTVTGNATLHAVFTYGSGSGSSGNLFTLNLTYSGSTYYVGTYGSNYMVATTDSSEAANFGMEETGTSGQAYLYYMNGSDKVYIGHTNTDKATVTSGTEYAWVVTESGSTIQFTSNGQSNRSLGMNYNSGNTPAARFSVMKNGSYITFTKTAVSGSGSGGGSIWTSTLEEAVYNATSPQTDGTSGNSATVTVNGTTVLSVLATRTPGTVTWAVTNGSDKISLVDDGLVSGRYQATVTGVAEGSATVVATASATGTKQTFNITVSEETDEYAVSYGVQSGVTVSGNSRSGNTITLPTAVSYSTSTYDAHTYTLVGWTTSSVSATTTQPSYSNPGATVTITDDTVFYPVYSYSGGSATYELVTANKSDWSGKYLVAYSDDTFADGRIGGTGSGAIGAQNVSVDPDSALSGTTVTAAWGDLYCIELEAVTGGYLMKTLDGNYNYWTNNTGNGLNSTATQSTAAGYPLSVTFNSSSDIAIAISAGAVFHYNTQAYFRFYKNGGQSAVYLYERVGGSGGTTTYTSTLEAATVADNYVGSVSASPSSLQISGSTATLTSSLTNNGTTLIAGTDYTVSYAITSGSAATLSGTTLTPGSSAGSVTVTATFTSGGDTLATATCTVNVVDPSAAVTVNYVGDYNGSNSGKVYNWGTRDTAATFLTAFAADYYTGSYSYDTLSALSGDSGTGTAFYSSTLGTAIHNMLVAKQTTTTSYSGTTSLYAYTDCTESKTSTGAISSYYSGTAIGPSWGSSPSWNREHTWPNSKGLDGSDENDIMMLRPTATSENSSRSNDAYGESSSYYDPNECGQNLRGDVARLMLQHLMRWGNTSKFYSTSGVIESRAVLLAWMEADPVDTWEMGRNDAVQRITGVRNVFVDYPELAFKLLGADVPSGYTTPSSSGVTASATYGNSNGSGYEPVTTSSATPAAAAPAAGTDESIPVQGNAIGIGTETRGVTHAATRSVGDTVSELSTNGMVYIDGYGNVSDLSLLQTSGPKNELYLPKGSAVVFKVNDAGANALAIGAKAVTGATSFQVYELTGDAEGKLLLEKNLSTCTEMYYSFGQTDGAKLSWTNGVSGAIMIYNSSTGSGDCILSLTNLRSGAASATMTINGATASKGASAVRALRKGTFTVNGGNDTPIIPIENPVAVLTSANLSLDGLIGVNFYVTVPSSLVNSGCYFTVNGEKADLVKVDGASTAYRVTGRVAAKEMNDTVELKFFTKNGSEKTFGQGSKDSMVSSYNYSVAQYLDAIAADAGSYSDTLLTLVKAMSAYGSYAQTYFKYGTGVAVDEATAAAINAVAIGADEYTYTYSANTANIKYYGESVVTESETAIRFYFTLGGSIGDYTVTVNGEAGQLVKAGKYYYVEVSNIAAKDLGKGNTVTVTYGGESLTIDGYSVYTYVKKQLSNTDANLVNAVKALKYYGDCAAAYFAEEGNN